MRYDYVVFYSHIRFVLLRKENREWEKILCLSDAYAQAIRECIRNDILSDYLSRKGSEVENMLIAEYDYDLDIEVQREEAMEDGIKIGEERGEKRVLVLFIIKKLHKGYDAEKIADILEEDPAVIAHICDIVKKYEPDYNVEKICMELMNESPDYVAVS